MIQPGAAGAGPVWTGGGVVAARQIASAAGFDNVITGDMGGTSFDVSLVADGEHPDIGGQHDFGMVVRTPMIEMTTIGAGGGSLPMMKPVLDIVRRVRV